MFVIDRSLVESTCCLHVEAFIFFQTFVSKIENLMVIFGIEFYMIVDCGMGSVIWTIFAFPIPQSTVHTPYFFSSKINTF